MGQEIFWLRLLAVNSDQWTTRLERLVHYSVKIILLLKSFDFGGLVNHIGSTTLLLVLLLLEMMERHQFQLYNADGSVTEY